MKEKVIYVLNDKVEFVVDQDGKLLHKIGYVKQRYRNIWLKTRYMILCPREHCVYDIKASDVLCEVIDTK